MKRQITAPAILVAVLLGVSTDAQAGGTVQSIRFPTSVTAPVYVIPKALKANEPLFRAGLQNLPEGLLVVGALVIGGGDLGLSPAQTANLTSLMTATYSNIAADPAFRQAPSALPYCFSNTKQTTGHYFLYRPEQLPTRPICIVFLHGYGGNFQYYMWVLKEELPDAIILTPSWGASWEMGSTTYVKDLLADAERHTGVDLGKPWLMAISAGGGRGFQIYNETPTNFSGYVCLASVPGTLVIRRLRRDLNILMLNGTADPMVPIALARGRAERAKQMVPTLRIKEIEGDHFFLLSKRKATFGVIRAFLNGG